MLDIMNLELIENKTTDTVWNWRTQEENLTIINILFQPNADTYVPDGDLNDYNGESSLINIQDFYLVSSTATSIKLQGNYTESLINRLNKLHFIDKFILEDKNNWFTSKSCIETEINNKIIKFTLDITLTYDEQ
jgi:hypothetical protein